jgi:hypothetical protein
LEESLAQSELVRTKIGGTRHERASTDRDFRGQTQVGITQNINTKEQQRKTKYKQEVARKDLETEQLLNLQSHI